MLNALEATKTAAKVALSKQASQVIVQDLTNLSDICNFQIICSGANDRQTQAISTSIEAELKRKFGILPTSIEGKQSGHWILLDYGVTIIHIFQKAIREYYRVDTLWPNAKEIKIEEDVAQTKAESQ
ncbi:MAG: ribosome silencing factor [Oligoflexales bacterium]|nr:ribosome silencing factor [Oligoflexales bacterium]